MLVWCLSTRSRGAGGWGGSFGQGLGLRRRVGHTCSELQLQFLVLAQLEDADLLRPRLDWVSTFPVPSLCVT